MNFVVDFFEKKYNYNSCCNIFVDMFDKYIVDLIINVYIIF